MAYLIVHPTFGVYLGNCMGLGFWSKVDPVGQPCAVTFPTPESAQQHMAAWEDGVPADAQLVPVKPDDGVYASIAACVHAGVEGWIDAYLPSAQSVPA